MGKLKFENVEAAKENLASTKEELAVAQAEKKAFEKENKLAKGEDHSESKVGKKWTKLNDQVQKKLKAIEDIKAYMSENKPKKEKAGRVTSYTYPADVVTAGDKKKYRAKMRAEAKKADKADAPAGESKKKKKTVEAPAETEAPKKKKKKVVAETNAETED